MGVESALKSLRRTCGVSQSRLAELSGVSVRTIRGIESGEIQSPHLATLTALTGSLNLSDDDQSRFIGSFAGPKTLTTFREVMNEEVHAGLQRVVYEGQIREYVNKAKVTAARHVHVGANRRILSIDHSDVVEALRDGVRTSLTALAGGDTIDTRLVTHQDLTGCRVNTSVVDEAANLVVTEFDLGRDLAKGELTSFAFRFDLGNAEPPTDPELAVRWHELVPETRFTQGSRRRINMLTLRITFGGEPPARIWQVGGRDGQVKIADLSLDAFNSATLVCRDEEPAQHGIEWAWD